MMILKKYARAFVAYTILLHCSFSGHAQPYNYYYGNIHSHTGYSDGAKDEAISGISTPAQAYAYAKKAKHLDFLGISEHNHSKAGMIDPANYHKGIAQAKAANKDGSFVCLYGMEFGTVSAGHVLIYGVDKLINWEEGNKEIDCEKGNYPQLWELLNATPDCFATLAHPDPENFSNLAREAYNEAADAVICGSAIRNGPHSSHSVDYDEPPSTSYYSYYKNLLAAGYKVGPTIDHDNHYTTFGRTTQGRTVVLASSLTKKNIVAAYKAMRFYASEDWNTKVRYTINGKTMGESMKGSHFELEVSVSDADKTDTITNVKVMSGAPGSGKTAKSFISEDVKDFKYEIDLLPEDYLYFYLEITQSDGDKIITSPIWLRGTGVI